MSNFPVIDFYGPEGTPNEWNVSHRQRLLVAIERGGSTLIRSQSNKPSYVIHRARVKQFKRADPDSGIPVPGGTSFSICVDLETRSMAQARVHVLEYDETGDRTGETRIAAGQSVHYVPRKAVRRIVLTIRIVGSGDVVIREFTVRSLPATENIPPGLHPLTDNGDPRMPVRDEVTSLQREVVSLENAGRRIGQQVNALLARLESASILENSATSKRDVNAKGQGFAQDLLLQMASSLPVSNGSHYFSRRFKQRIAIITDIYMLNFYKDTFENVVYVQPQRVDEVISDGFDLLLYVTCWQGVHDDEWRGIKFRAGPATALAKLLEHCQSNSIPTIFQSIEDPSNFEYFLPIAAQFDHVFTSDSDCIDRYREELGHDRIHYGEYGANPLLNNPIGNQRFTIDRAFFAGSYPERYPERTEDMQILFDSILRVGPYLQIADRNAGAQGLEFPSRFQPYCMPPIPHELLQRVHKLFRYNLNFNSIKDSPTMCAMRVYELQAQGRGILSNYARSVLNKFPEIRIVTHPECLDGYFGRPPTHEERQNNEQLIRNVMTSATSFDIVGRMLTAIGLGTDGVAEAPTVTLFGDLSDERVRAAINRQSYPNIISKNLTDARDQGTHASTGAGYFGILDSTIEYGPDYVRDRVNSFKFTDVDFVTQQSTIQMGGHLNGPVHDFTSTDPDVTLTLFASDRIDPRLALANHSHSGSRGYAIPPYQAVPSRSIVNTPRGVRHPLVERPTLSVVVPVYENGRFLTAKCMPSIMRNPEWHNYEIVLVDDGSMDDTSVSICEGFARTYPNVQFYSFADGGSGSASRPRNKGVELSRAPLVAFLDPDNEISDGGYDTLVQLYTETAQTHPELGFVSGYQVKVARKSTITGRHTSERLSIVENAKQRFFLSGKFPVVSTQAAVIAKDLFTRAPLSFVEGAAGQDTLFGWELLLGAQTGAFTDAAHLVYYAERAGSVTNAVSPQYFKKKLVMERAQVSALRHHGLFDSYVEHHLPGFVQGWYMKKLDNVTAGDRDESLQLIRQIVALYGADFDQITQPMNDHTGEDPRRSGLAPTTPRLQ